MENKFRNEMLIKVGGKELLLRPTFENVSAMESSMGGLGYLAVKMAAGGNTAKALPSLSDCAKVIYFNQAGHLKDDPTKKEYSIEEIWELIQEEGIAAVGPVVEFISKITSGNKILDKLSAEEKKKELAQ